MSKHNFTLPRQSNAVNRVATGLIFGIAFLVFAMVVVAATSGKPPRVPDSPVLTATGTETQVKEMVATIITPTRAPTLLSKIETPTPTVEPTMNEDAISLPDPETEPQAACVLEDETSVKSVLESSGYRSQFSLLQTETGVMSALALSTGKLKGIDLEGISSTGLEVLVFAPDGHLVKTWVNLAAAAPDAGFHTFFYFADPNGETRPMASLSDLGNLQNQPSIIHLYTAPGLVSDNKMNWDTCLTTNFTSILCDLGKRFDTGSDALLSNLPLKEDAELFGWNVGILEKVAKKNLVVCK